MASRRIRSTAALLVAVAAGAGLTGCVVPEDGDSGGGDGGGGFRIEYCEEDHRGDLNEARCYDEPDGDR
jgi:hypothetical protein